MTATGQVGRTPASSTRCGMACMYVCARPCRCLSGCSLRTCVEELRLLGQLPPALLQPRGRAALPQQAAQVGGDGDDVHHLPKPAEKCADLQQYARRQAGSDRW